MLGGGGLPSPPTNKGPDSLNHNANMQFLYKYNVSISVTCS